MIQFEQYRLNIPVLQEKITNLRSALHIDLLNNQIEELENEAASPNFWDNMEHSQKITKSLKQKKDTVEDYENLQNSLDDLSTLISIALEEEEESIFEEVVSEHDSLCQKIEDITLQTLLSGKYDGNNAILTFHAGAGGTEAQDWVSMLYRMYMRWCERHGFVYKVLDYLDGEEAGIKSATVLVEGVNAYGYLKSEMGVHRLVRVSPFDSSGRRHTSFASVEIMPEIDADTKVEIRSEDLRVDTYRASGAGGQHINKTSSAVRLTHIPTGLVVACQNERSQFQNKDMAMRMLMSKLIEIKEREHLDEISDIKGVQKEIGWGSQIRSYVFMPYTLAKDHRTGFESGNINGVMDGDLDGFINAYLKMGAPGAGEEVAP